MDEKTMNEPIEVYEARMRALEWTRTKAAFLAKIESIQNPKAPPFLWVGEDRETVERILTEEKGSGLEESLNLREAANARLNKTVQRGEVKNAWLMKPVSTCMYLEVARKNDKIGALMLTKQLQKPQSPPSK